MQKAFNPLVLLPGTLFWVMFIVALTTKNRVAVIITVILGVGTFVGFGSRAIVKWRREKNVKRRVWAEGSPGVATVLEANANGSLNNHPYVEMKLHVAGGRIVHVRQVISQIMVSKVQPGEEIAVRVDQLDPSVVVVDEALTPYGY